jgi:hypothetical protein
MKNSRLASRDRFIIPVLVCFTLLLTACGVTTQDDPTANAENQAPPAATFSTELPPSVWTELAPGVEQRLVTIAPPYALATFTMPILRFDPEQVQFRVHYDPDQLLPFSAWVGELEDALVIFNASFFTPEGKALGLVVEDGEVHGRSLLGYGGMFSANQDAVVVQSLISDPYGGEPLDQAVQGFPLYIAPGGEPASTGDGFDDPARRTIIGQDADGFIYLMVTPEAFDWLTLRNTQDWLLKSDLNLDVAFNLDGGRSSGLYIAPNDTLYPSIALIPVVVGVYPR